MLSLTASLLHEGSGYAITKAAIDVDGKTVADAEITFKVMAVSGSEIPRQHERRGEPHRVPGGGACAWLIRRGRPGSPGSASCPPSAKGPDAHWQALEAGKIHIETTALRALRRPSAGAGEFRSADSEEGRPAADGAVAADRDLCRRARARQCRRQGQCRVARPDGHDRRGRRRRARPCRRQRDPHRPAQGRRAGAVPQRAG